MKIKLLLIIFFCFNLYGNTEVNNISVSDKGIYINDGYNKISVSEEGIKINKTIPEKKMFDDFMYLFYIIIFVSCFVFFIIKFLFKYHMDISDFEKSVNRFKPTNKFETIKTELLFILNKNVKSSIALNRIKDLINIMEKRYKENSVLIDNIKLNTTEIKKAKEENEVILNNLLSILKNTQINKQEINFNDISNDIEHYLNLIHISK